MGQVRYTARARADLLDIWAHVAARNPSLADRILDRVDEGCRVLRDHPRLGRARPELGEGARMLVIERWLALYRVVEGGVQVVRVVDGARDIKRLEWTAGSPTDE